MGRVHMAFEIIAEKAAETVRMQRNSSLMAVAKAQVWAAEGWTVTVVVSDEEPMELGEEFAPSLMYKAVSQIGFQRHD
jgi:hypothetical protein